MKQFLLATALIAVPVAPFSAYEHYLAPPAAADQSQVSSKGLGDLADFKVITNDVQKIAATGDLKAAEKRATDFETEWDDKQASLRPLDPIAWGNVDAAADGLFKSLRNGSPSADKVDAALATLKTVLDTSGANADKPGAGEKGAKASVSGIAVTDAAGHPVPCEDLINRLKDASSRPDLDSGRKTKADALLNKALERCNADDDQRADAFSAQGIALLAK
jgi:hypothetical protein